MFIGRFIEISSNTARYRLDSVVPITPVVPSLPELVVKLSPAFVKIYQQAISAEAAGLDEIFGVGLRKALEFLIKDYACANHTDKTDEVRKLNLSDVINNFISAQNIKNCAKRAAWLGNDETHYVRKWEDKDIKDLKLLLKLTVDWISSELYTQEYMKSMGPS
jgi:hypothetical protein